MRSACAFVDAGADLACIGAADYVQPILDGLNERAASDQAFAEKVTRSAIRVMTLKYEMGPGAIADAASSSRNACRKQAATRVNRRSDFHTTLSRASRRGLSGRNVRLVSPVHVDDAVEAQRVAQPLRNHQRTVVQQIVGADDPQVALPHPAPGAEFTVEAGLLGYDERQPLEVVDGDRLPCGQGIVAPHSSHTQTSQTGMVMYAYLVVSYGSNSSAKSSSPESRREVTSSVLPE